MHANFIVLSLRSQDTALDMGHACGAESQMSRCRYFELSVFLVFAVAAAGCKGARPTSPSAVGGAVPFQASSGVSFTLAGFVHDYRGRPVAGARVRATPPAGSDLPSAGISDGD